MPSKWNVVHLRQSHIARAGDVLALAFDADPIFRSLVPDSGERYRSLSLVFRAVVEYTLTHGIVYATPNLEGVICWLPPGKTRITGRRIAAAGFGLAIAVRRLSPAIRRRFLRGTDYTAAVHKRIMPEPHWYLLALGVQPEQQGRGIGSALMAPILTGAGATGVPCYLETQTDRNLGFYRRFGFEVAETGQIPGDTLPLWFMVRCG